MEIQLAPLAQKLRRAAKLLLFFSILRLFSPDDMFGAISACTVLCCAAPGPLGSAYASRFARTTSQLAALGALFSMIFAIDFIFSEAGSCLKLVAHHTPHTSICTLPRQLPRRDTHTAMADG